MGVPRTTRTYTYVFIKILINITFLKFHGVHGHREATTHAQRGNITAQPRDLNLKASQNAERLPTPAPQCPFFTSHFNGHVQKQNAATASRGSHFIRTLLRLGKCSAVTSPSDSSSTQPGTWRQSKTFPPPCRQQRDGKVFFHGPLLLPINASTTTRYDQCWLHGYHPCLVRHRA